jgi:hypothetical protein
MPQMCEILSLVDLVQNAAVDMEKAVSELEESGVDSYILDLRNNPVCIRLSFTPFQRFP